MGNMIFVFYGAIIIGMIITLTVSSTKARKKTRLDLEQAFGKIPVDKNLQMNSIEAFHLQQAVNCDTTLWVDDITWDDLDMDLIYKRINACHSSVGEEYLYHILHTPCFDQAQLDAREQLIAFLGDNAEARYRLQLLMHKLGKANNNGLASLMDKSFVKPLKYPIMYTLLSCVPLLGVVLLPFLLSLGVGIILCSLFVNVIVYYSTKKKIEYDLIALSYFSQMLLCCSRLCKTDEMQPFITEIKQHYAVFQALTSKIPVAAGLKNSELDFFTEYVRVLFLSDLRSFNKTVKLLNSNTSSFESLYKALGEVDLCLCLCSYRKSMSLYCKPVLHSKNEIIFSKIYHPLLKEPVTNDASISNDTIITGSNASGKSTFIKAVAINGILAQTINTCTAEGYSTIPTLIITSMAVKDNISDGDSYFITEIKSLKRILDKVEHTHCCCFIDEILKGTNTIERIAASAAVLKHLYNKNCLCVVASHDIELTQILQQQYTSYHFSEQITDDGIFFDYLLKMGPSKTRNAIKLLGFMAFDKELVTDAEALVDNFMNTHKW